MKKQLFIFSLLMLAVITISAQSNVLLVKPSLKSKTDSLTNKHTVGVAIDLLPPVLSASTGNFGYSAQLWYGFKKFRVRGVVAGFQMPNKLMGNDDFKDLKTRATALIVDCFKNNKFEGWWLGTGLEIWDNTISSKLDNRTYDFKDYVATAGSGYIIKLHKNFYIEPWAAMHYVFNNEKVLVGATEYKTKKFQAEVSLKVGWHF